MRSSYSEKDVILLLKDITGLVHPQSTEEREREIQNGRHYCEMLPIEYVPTEKYMQVYNESLSAFAQQTADATARLSKKIIERKGRDTVLVSLARAGIPVGILIKRYIRKFYNIDMPHYSVSIIRGRGIDKNAMNYLLERYSPSQLLFVDGWTGKGAIYTQLQQAMADYENISSDIAVIADPANITELCGTHEDILIPSSCLNSTVSGLVSRTFLRGDIIGENDFHGAVYYKELKDSDISYDFINAIESRFRSDPPEERFSMEKRGIDEVRSIAEKFGIDDINLIKPGIGETTRVLLRRVPDRVLINENDANDPGLSPIYRLAKEKGVPVYTYPLKNYKACGIIKKLSDT